MGNSITDLIGYLAATLTTIAFLPQAIHSLRTRNLEGVSLSMYGIFTAGVAFWLLYGAILGAAPVIIANAITLPLASVMLVLKLREKQLLKSGVSVREE